MDAEPRFIDMLEVLVRHETDFIIVGGIAAILHGAPIMTADLDILFNPTAENVARLVPALEELGAIYKDPAGRKITPDASRLATFRLNLLTTKLGPLDVLRTIGDGLTYPDLIGRSEEYAVAGLQVRVLSLEAIIETKEYAGRPKDLNTVPYLRQILEMKELETDED